MNNPKQPGPARNGKGGGVSMHVDGDEGVDFLAVSICGGGVCCRIGGGEEGAARMTGDAG